MTQWVFLLALVTLISCSNGNQPNNTFPCPERQTSSPENPDLVYGTFLKMLGDALMK